MKILIVEDDFGSRKLLQNILTPYADCDMAVNGEEAFEAAIGAEALKTLLSKKLIASGLTKGV